MILKLLLSIQIICKVFKKILILKHYSNVDKECTNLIVFDDMIADMINNKKLNSVVTKLFISGRKLNVSFAFITQSCFKVPKDARLNSTRFFIMKFPNKRELQ